MNQRSKIVKLAEDYGLLDAKPAATPMETGFLTASPEDTVELKNNSLYRKVMGSLLYIATVSRPDIAVAFGFLCRRVEKPSQYDWNAAKRVIRYLMSTSEAKLRLSSAKDDKLIIYVDADWAGDKVDRKSTSGYVFLFGRAVIAWCSRKQTSVAISSTEAEYIAASFASRELLWLRQLFKDMGIPLREPITMYEDNQGCIKLISGSGSARSKHIDVCYHQIRDLLEKGLIKVYYCLSEEMLADILTKPLAREEFMELAKLLGMSSLEHSGARRSVGKIRS